MRFKRHERFPFTDTSRKRAALRRKQRLEREAMPLLSDLIAERQPTEDEVMDERAHNWARSEQRTRDWKAERWRKARRQLDAMSHNERVALKAAWDRAPYPADPTYLLDFLHAYKVGRFTLDTIPFERHMPMPAHHHGGQDGR